jgi:hypothetical protein
MKIINDLEEKVLFFQDALNDRNFKAATRSLHPNFLFQGVLGIEKGGSNYIDILKTSYRTYHLLKIFSNRDSVCSIYELKIPEQKNTTVCALYGFRENKIATLQLFQNLLTSVKIKSEDEA